MPHFMVEGFDRDTGRRRKRTYQGANIDAAILKASEDGTIVDVGTVRRVYPIQHLYTKVAGASHQNRDGSERQQIIRSIKAMEQLVLKPLPRNRYSSHAVGVFRQSGEQLGFLGDELAGDVMDGIKDEGVTFLCFASGVTGGDAAGKPLVGLNLIVLALADPETSAETVGEYLRNQVANEQAV